MLVSFTRRNEELVKEIFNIIYYFRGALSRDDAWAMSPVERQMAVELINKKVEEAKDLISHKISPSL